MIAVCDLADDLRDVIVEYQVSTDIEKRTLGGSLMRLIVITAEGDLRAELYTDCKLQNPGFEKTLDIDLPLQDTG